jgi:hypothetical protein
MAEQVKALETTTRLERIERIAQRLEEDRAAVDWTMRLFRNYLRRGIFLAPELQLFQEELKKFADTLKTLGAIAKHFKDNGGMDVTDLQKFEAVALKMHGAIKFLKSVDSSFVKAGAPINLENIATFVTASTVALPSIANWNASVELAVEAARVTRKSK